MSGHYVDTAPGTNNLHVKRFLIDLQTPNITCA